MSRATLLALAVACAAGCGGGAPIPEVDLLLRVEAGRRAVEPGRGFPLTVTRIHRKELAAAPFDERSLRPLVVRLEEESRREDGTRVEERRRYRAYAFGPKEVTVRLPAFAARPREGGDEIVAPVDPVRIRVVGTVDPEDPGPLELPGPPLAEPFPAGTAALLGTAILGAAAILLVRRGRRRAPEPPPAPAPATPDAAARALGRLREAPSVEAVAAILRDYLAERFGLRAANLTTEEIASAHPGVRAPLAAADLAKFARWEPDAAGRAAIVGEAERFVRAGAPPPGEVRGAGREGPE